MRIFAVLLACLIGVSAQAATYKYVGATYSTTTYQRGSLPADFPGLRGPYDNSMRVTASFTVSGPLAASSYFNAANSALNWTISDGIHTFSKAAPARFPVDFNSALPSFEIWTNAAGNISDWIIERLCCSSDFELITSYSRTVGLRNPGFSSSLGDGASYFIELTEQNNEFEQAQARTLASGSWSVVPLPASAWMLLAGLCGLWGLGRYRMTS